MLCQWWICEFICGREILDTEIWVRQYRLNLLTRVNHQVGRLSVSCCSCLRYSRLKILVKGRRESESLAFVLVCSYPRYLNLWTWLLQHHDWQSGFFLVHVLFTAHKQTIKTKRTTGIVFYYERWVVWKSRATNSIPEFVVKKVWCRSKALSHPWKENQIHHGRRYHFPKYCRKQQNLRQKSVHHRRYIIFSFRLSSS